jgi:hypothetical protein
MEEEKVPMMEDAEKGDAMEEKKNEDGRPEPIDEDFCDCCCKCQCHDPTSRNERCCCCMPLRCGVNWIILLTIAYVLLEFITIVMLYQNVYFEWYYPTILLLLLAPAFVALAFFLNYWCGDSKAARNKLGTGCILLAASAGAIAIWEIIYFSCIYKSYFITPCSVTGIPPIFNICNSYFSYRKLGERGHPILYSRGII